MTTQFSDLGLAEPIARALRDANYVTPTPIQARAIPSLLEGHDLLGIAQTGTGKTAAFALPILNKLVNDRKPQIPGRVRALILAPTRELATQIADSFKSYGKYCGIRVACIVGGVSAGPQIQNIGRGCDVIVATPGRLLDHMSSGKLKLDMTDTIVLDEADHMLDLGFVIPIRKIVAKLPKIRQSLFFSATMPKEIAVLADEMLHNPVKVAITPTATTVERIKQEVYFIEGAAKCDLLVELLANPEWSRAIVFTRTKRGADKVTRRLEVANIDTIAIHGNKSQAQRQRALDSFKAGKVRVLVATDIAARGIDVDGISHVVNYDLPEVAEAYVHRIGRTARAGAQGIAVSLCENAERNLLRQIERVTRQSLPVTDRRGTIVPTKEPAAAKADFRDPRAPAHGRHKVFGGPNRGDRARPDHRPDHRADARPDHRPAAPRADAPRSDAPRFDPLRADKPRFEGPRPARTDGPRPARNDSPRPARNDGPRAARVDGAGAPRPNRADASGAPAKRRWKNPTSNAQG